jgi:hypothetical protein
VLGRMGLRSLESISQISAMGSGAEDSRPLPFERQFMRSAKVKDAFDARYIEIYREVFRTLPRDAEQWEAAVEAMRRIERKVESDSSLSNTLNRIMMPVFTQAGEAVGQTIARRRVSQCAVRLLEMRLGGALPAKLPNFDKISIDPFTGHRLIYRREGNGFIVYSVGRDGNDDGGIRTSKAGAGRDVVAEFR